MSPRPAAGEACNACLRRSWLIGSLAAEIERAASERPAHRTRRLLALEDSEIAAAVAGRGAESVARSAAERDPAVLREAVAGARCWACCLHSPDYPDGLRNLDDAPAVLFGRGDQRLLALLAERPAVTMVGARRPSAYGREMGERIAGELAAAGVPVVSGMALGVDSCCHEGALGGGGLTVAVLGCGPDVVYPASGEALYGRILAEGLVLSELPPGTEVRKWTFPARNRIMAALGQMTVVVEARARSGSRITAEIAGDLGREVGAVPGHVGHASATGTNELIREGAHLIRSGRDVLDSLAGPGLDWAEAVPEIELDGAPAIALEAVESGDGTLDGVAIATGLTIGEAATALTQLELLGLVRCGPAGTYERTTTPA